MRSLVVLWTCLATVVAGCGLGATNETRLRTHGFPLEAGADSAYDLGRQQLLAGDYGSAVRQLRASLRSRPGSPEILNALAVAYEQLGRRDISQTYFAQALAADPGSVQTLNNVARSLMQAGSVDVAGSYLRRAAALDPENTIVRSNLQLIASGVQLNPAERMSPISAHGANAPPWIERASPALQTLVTRPVRPPVQAAAPDEAMPLLASFVSVSFAPANAAEDGGGGWSMIRRPAASAPGRGPSSAAALSVVNGNGRTRMAARVAAYLEGRGWKAARLLNADHFAYARTTIVHRSGFAAEARTLAALLPVPADIAEGSGLDTDILLQIGKDILGFDSHFTG